MLLAEDGRANRHRRFAGDTTLDPILRISITNMYQWGGILCIDELYSVHWPSSDPKPAPKWRSRGDGMHESCMRRGGRMDTVCVC